MFAMAANLTKSELLGLIYKTLCRELPPRRFLHVMGVIHRAADLAAVVGADVDKAVLAAALHDIGKGQSPEDLRERLREWGSDVPDDDEPYPPLWHAIYGREVARRDFGIDDKNILDAIEFHPTGRPAMSKVEAALFLADYTEPLRQFEPENPILETVERDLTQAIYFVLCEKIAHVQRKDKPVHPRALEALNFYNPAGSKGRK